MAFGPVPFIGQTEESRMSARETLRLAFVCATVARAGSCTSPCARHGLRDELDGAWLVDGGVLLEARWGRKLVVVKHPRQSLGGFISLDVELLDRNERVTRKGLVTVGLDEQPVGLIELRTSDGDPQLRHWRLGVAFAPGDGDAREYRRTGTINPAKAIMDDTPGGSGWLDVEVVQWADEPELPFGYGNLVDVKRIEFRRAERSWPAGRQWDGVVTIEGAPDESASHVTEMTPMTTSRSTSVNADGARIVTSSPRHVMGHMIRNDEAGGGDPGSLPPVRPGPRQD
jgi:hypothetical protein